MALEIPSRRERGYRSRLRHAIFWARLWAVVYERRSMSRWARWRGYELHRHEKAAWSRLQVFADGEG